MHKQYSPLSLAFLNPCSTFLAIPFYPKRRLSEKALDEYFYLLDLCGDELVPSSPSKKKAGVCSIPGMTLGDHRESPLRQ